MAAQPAIDQFLHHDVFRQMLLEQGSISLKGIGSIKIERSSAVLLPAEQNLLPPSYGIALYEYMDNAYDEQSYLDIYLGKAKYTWSDFNQLALTHLMNYGKFQIAGIGVLSRDAAGKISFLSDSETLQMLNSGYITISLKPIKREYTPEHLELNPEPLNVSRKKSWSFKRLLTLMVMFLVIFMLYRYLDYMFQWSVKGDTEIVDLANLDAMEEGTADPEILAKDEVEVSNQKDEVVKEEPSLSPELLHCIIITGSFKSKGNVDRMIRRLTEIGYQTYTEQYGTYTRVGVSFDCAENNLVDSIASVRKKINIQSWFLSPELAVETM
jgi:hypothetical protein